MPSCNDRSMRRSSVAWASRAAARVAVSSATRRDRSVSGPAARRARPGRAWSRAMAGVRPRMIAIQPSASRVTARASGQPWAWPRPTDVLVAFSGMKRQYSGNSASRTAISGSSSPISAEQQPERAVPGQPAQLPPGGRVGEGEPQPGRCRVGPDDLGAPPGEPVAFTVGEGVQGAQHGGGHEQSDAHDGRHGGDGQPDQHGQRQHRGPEPADELSERGAGGLGGPDRARPDPGPSRVRVDRLVVPGRDRHPRLLPASPTALCGRPVHSR